MGRAGFFTRCALVLLVGCSPVKATEPDAAVDAGPDADEGGDATIVTESALFGSPIGTKVGNIDIVSMLPNNTVLAMARTDAGGTATIRVYPGGTVTAIYRHPAPDMGADLITWAGVSPGDKLTFGNRQPSFGTQQNTNLGAMTYTWPAQTGAGAYYVVTSCSGNGVGPATTSISMNEFSLCHQEPMDVLFITVNNSGQLTHYSSRTNVTFTSGGTVTAGPWSAAQTAQVTITGLPPEVTQLGGAFTTVLDGVSEQNFTGGYNGTPTGGAFTGSFPWHPTGDRTVSQLFLGRPGFSSMQIYEALPSTATTSTIAAPTLTPWLQGGVLGSSALRTARWFLVPDAASVHDGQLLRMNWSHNIGGNSHPHQWHIIMPPDQTSIEFPKLPAQFAENLPAPQDGMGISVRVFDVASVTSYDMLRTLPSSTAMCLECAVRAGDVPRVVISE